MRISQPIRVSSPPPCAACRLRRLRTKALERLADYHFAPPGKVPLL